MPQKIQTKCDILLITSWLCIVEKYLIKQQRTNGGTITAKAVVYYQRLAPLDACK